MRILYYFAEDERVMTQWQRFHFFDELSHYGISIEVVNPNLFNSITEANEAVIKKAKGNDYDLFLTCYCNEKWIFGETIDALKSMGLPTLSFRPDNLVIPFNDETLCSKFDLLWLTSKETQHFYKKWGASTFFAPYAANPFVFNPVSNCDDVQKVCFVGTPYGSRSIMMNTLTSNDILVDAFCRSNRETSSRKKRNKSNGFNIDRFFDNLKYREGRKIIYGNIVNRFAGNRKLDLNGCIELLPKVGIDRLPSIYSSYRLSLSSTSALNTDVLKSPVKIINLRGFEIPMCGGLQICRYNPELAEYFEEDKEIVFYRDKEELVDKCRYYTKPTSDKVVAAMKSAARQRAEREHTWMNRFKVAFEILGLKI